MDSSRWQAKKGTPEDDMPQNNPEKLGEGHDHMGAKLKMPQRTGRDGDKLLPDVLSCTGALKMQEWKMQERKMEER